MSRFFGLIGIVLIFLLAYAMSNNKKAINYKTIGTGFALQVLLALFIFKVPFGRALFLGIGQFVQKILDFFDFLTLFLILLIAVFLGQS